MTPPSPREQITAALEEFGPLPAKKLLRILARRYRRSIWTTMDGELKAGRVGVDELGRLVPVEKSRIVGRQA